MDRKESSSETIRVDSEKSVQLHQEINQVRRIGIFGYVLELIFYFQINLYLLKGYSETIILLFL